MNKLPSIDWRTFAKVFEADGFVFDRQSGSHRVYVKPGNPRPLVIPMHETISPGVIMTDLKTAGMTRERFMPLLALVK